MEDMNNQTKSKKRMADHGEVFTSEREVNAMLDLVKQETERIDSRFLDIILQRLIQFNYLKSCCVYWCANSKKGVQYK